MRIQLQLLRLWTLASSTSDQMQTERMTDTRSEDELQPLHAPCFYSTAVIAKRVHMTRSTSEVFFNSTPKFNAGYIRLAPLLESRSSLLCMHSLDIARNVIHCNVCRPLSVWSLLLGLLTGSLCGLCRDVAYSFMTVAYKIIPTV